MWPTHCGAVLANSSCAGALWETASTPHMSQRAHLELDQAHVELGVGGPVVEVDVVVLVELQEGWMTQIRKTPATPGTSSK
jgi:hypothetical protein